MNILTPAEWFAVVVGGILIGFAIGAYVHLFIKAFFP